MNRAPGYALDISGGSPLELGVVGASMFLIKPAQTACAGMTRRVGGAIVPKRSA